MGPAWVFAYAVPFVLVAFVAAVAAVRNQATGVRRLVVARHHRQQVLRLEGTLRQGERAQRLGSP